MNILSRLEQMYQTYGDEIFRESSDALALEQLLSDKLYRSLLLALSSEKNDKSTEIIEESLHFYELSRLIEISKEFKDRH